MKKKNSDVDKLVESFPIKDMHPDEIPEKHLPQNCHLIFDNFDSLCDALCDL